MGIILGMKMKKTSNRRDERSKSVPENRIAEHRQKRNLSQRELAELAGIEASTLNKIENRTRNITGGELITLSRVLKVPTYDLLVVAGSPTPEFQDQIRMNGVIIAVRIVPRSIMRLFPFPGGTDRVRRPQRARRRPPEREWKS